LNGSLETDAAHWNPLVPCGLVHESAGAVVGNEVHQNFFANHFRGFAAQHIHAEGDLDLAEEQFDIPAPEIEFSQFGSGIGHGVKQGSDKGELRSSYG